MPAAELPAPASGLFQEISFRRLLATCEDIVAGTSTSRPDLVGNWQRSPVFHHYVETLQEQLADLEASAGSRLQRQLLQQYGEHVEALASQLHPPDVPAFCSTAAPPAAVLQQSRAAGGVTLPGAVPRPAVVPPVLVPRIPALQPPSSTAAPQPEQQSAAAAAGAAAGAPGAAATAAAARPASRPPAGTPAGPSSRLQTQQQLHEDLTDELAGLAAQLKSNTQAIEGKLKERGQLLDSTEAALDTSLQKTKASKEQATAIHRKGRANFCLTCLVMLIIGLVFAGMYVFIKVTRLAGYHAAVPVPAVPLAPPAVPPLEGVPVYEDHMEL